MSSAIEDQSRLDDHPKIRQVVSQWVEGMAHALESMAGHKPQTSWRFDGGATESVAELTGPDAKSEVLWWEQPFQHLPNATFWVGTPKAAWEYLGGLTLRAAGIESFEPGEARSTWFEILGQSLSVMARAIGAEIGREVNCGPGVERAPGPDAKLWGLLTLSFPEAALAPLLFTFSPELRQAVVAPPEPPAEPPTPAPHDSQPATQDPPANLRTMELLLDVDLPVSISFGKAQLPLKDVLKLTTGSIVELNRGVNDQVEVLVNHCLIARGEVVVVEGNYGVRIQEIASRRDRLRSLS